MERPLIYRLSIGLAVLLTLAAFITLLGWFGALARGAGHLPAISLIPWPTLGLVALAALNCTLRARRFVRRSLADR